MSGRITEEEIKELKRDYDEIYLTSLGASDVVFRALTVKECKESLAIADNESSIDSEEYVIGTGVVWPSNLNLDDYMVGEVSALSDEILEASGFADLDVCRRKIEEAREATGELTAFMAAMIIASNQKYGTEDIENMTFSQLAEKTALAERIFALQSMVARGEGEAIILEAVPPEEEEQQIYAKPRETADFTPEEWEAIQNGQYRNPEKDSTIGTATAEDPIARKLREALGG